MTNPMARIKYSAGNRKERDDFTPEERKLILILAREAEPHVHWINWLCSFLGTRTSEVADASTLDIECIDGIWVMSIHRKHRSRDQRLKTKVSIRKLALHGALLDEGLLDYWRSLPLGGPLFPNVPLDTYGKRASKVTTECSIWLRQVVKITDPNKPFYSHRHTATSYLRNPRLPDGITRCQGGHRALHPRPCGQGSACWLWQAVVRDTEGRRRSHPEPARRFGKRGANSPIVLNSPAARFVFTLVAATGRSTAAASRTSPPSYSNGVHLTPQTGCSSKVGYPRGTGENI
jgi:hypothetical protein